jgi:hypothetical protein
LKGHTCRFQSVEKVKEATVGALKKVWGNRKGPAGMLPVMVWLLAEMINCGRELLQKQCAVKPAIIKNKLKSSQTFVSTKHILKK